MKNSLVEMPKALFEDEDINTNRGDYIKSYMIGEEEVVPAELIRKHGLYPIPRSILVEVRKGTLLLADLSFLFACYYVASINKRKRIQMTEVLECITKNWDDFRTSNTAERFTLILSDMQRYKRWIKWYEHNNKYYVKY